MSMTNTLASAVRHALAVTLIAATPAAFAQSTSGSVFGHVGSKG